MLIYFVQNQVKRVVFMVTCELKVSFWTESFSRDCTLQLYSGLHIED